MRGPEEKLLMQFSKDLIIIITVKKIETIDKDIKMFNLGKLFIKDFVDELEMQEILLDEEEIEKISAYADAEGQVQYVCKIILYKSKN